MGGLINPFKPFRSLFNKFQKKSIKHNPNLDRVLKQDLDLYSGEKNPLENPDKVLEDHQETLKLYDEMMIDDCIAGTMELRKLIVLSVPWSIVSASDEKEDIEIADNITNMFNNFCFETKSPQYYSIPFNHVLNSLMDAKRYGCRCGEKRFEYDEELGFYRLINITFMHQKYFDFGYDEYNNLNSLHIGRNYGLDTVINGIDAIYDKFIIFVNPYLKDGNYYGESDLKNVYRQYWAKKNIFNFRNIHLERWGSPLPIGIYDKNQTTATELTNMQDTLKLLQNRYYILQPGQRSIKDDELKGKFKFDFYEQKNTQATEAYEKAIDQIDIQIKRRLLIPDKLGFSASDGGSYALGKEHKDIFYQVIKWDHTELENCINPTIRQICDYNWNIENYPRFEFAEIKGEIEQQLLKILFDYKVIDPAEKWLRPHYSIPELSEKEQKEIEKEKEEKENDKSDIDNDIDIDSNNNSDMDIDEKQLAIKKDFFDAKKIKKTLDNDENDFIKDYSKIYRFNLSKLLGQIERKKIIENKDYNAIKALRINKTNLQNLFSEYYAKLYFQGKAQAIEEVAPRINASIKADEKIEELEAQWLDRSWIDNYLEEYGELGILTKADKEYLKNIRDRAFFITGIQEEDILKDTYYILDNGIKSGIPAYQIIDQIKEQGLTRLQKYARTIARTNASDMYNTGRMNMFLKSPLKDFIEIYRYSAILDDRTTLFCEQHNDQLIRSTDSEFIYINPPNHFNCRSMLIAILRDEKNIKGNPNYRWDEKYKSWGEGITNKQALKPDIGFGGNESWSDIKKQTKELKYDIKTIEDKNKKYFDSQYHEIKTILQDKKNINLPIEIKIDNSNKEKAKTVKKNIQFKHDSTGKITEANITENETNDS